MEYRTFDIKTRYDESDNVKVVLNKLQTKYPDFKFQIDSKEEKKHNNYYIVYNVSFSNDILKQSGYEYIATLKKENESKEVTIISNLDQDFSKYYNIDFKCDHCNTQRYRKTVHIFRKNNKDYMIASSCSNDYFGIDVESVIKKQIYICDVLNDLGLSELKESTKNSDFDVKNYCNIVFGYITTKKIFVSTKNSDFDTLSTADQINCLFNDYIKNHDTINDCIKITKKENFTLENLITYWESKEQNTFNHNMVVNLKKFIPNKNMICYTIYEYMIEKLDFLNIKKQREINIKLKETLKTDSKHIGNIKDKLNFKGKIIKLHHFETIYGDGTFVNIIDTNNNMYIWKASKYIESEINIECTIKGTVKDHSIYNDTKQTVITRCKII